jgi:hypothetical protein
MRMIFGIFPLLAIPIVIYNIMALTGAAFPTPEAEAVANGASAMAMRLANPADGWQIFGSWRLTSGDILVILSMVFFFVEIIKSTSTGSSTIANHAI